MEIEAYDISEWQRRTWFHTKGTREKFACESPTTGQTYYFKESLSKPPVGNQPGYGYPSEIWSEIIASKVGKMLGFNLLDYNLAYFETGIGCICENMLKPRQSLVEGFQYLTAVERDFLPDTDYQSRKLYDYQLIEKALKAFSLERFLPDLIDVIFFDAIVGNSDRHQENWGFIYHVENAHRYLIKEQSRIEKYEKEIVSNIMHGSLIRQLDEYDAGNDSRLFRLVKKFFNNLSRKNINKIQDKPVEDLLKEVYSHVLSSPVIPDDSVVFSPIYDSGSSLGREVSEEKILIMSKDKNQFNTYIKKGKSEIHWANKKLAHNELLLSLSESHGDIIRRRLQEVSGLFNRGLIISLLSSANDLVPDREIFLPYKISSGRRSFIADIIEARIELISKTLTSSL